MKLKLLSLLTILVYFSACAKDAVVVRGNSSNKGFDVVSKISAKEQRTALVIGNNNYTRDLPVLRNPMNDARAMKNILEQRNFDVIYLENGTKKSTRQKLQQFYRKIRKGGVGLLYFSGHGIEVDGQNYLIPVDADLEEKDDAQFESIALNQITNKMKNANNRLNMVILDACRSNPFTKAIGSGGLAKTEPIGLFVSFATSANKTASDGRRGENGLFTKYLIENMTKEGLTLPQVFKKTAEAVYMASNHKQFPAIYDRTINGDFYFTLPLNVPIVKPTPVIVNPIPLPTPINLVKSIHYAGGTYTGDLKSGVPHGKGEIIWTNGDKYVGEWKSGKKQGMGTFFWVSGNKYKGQWVNNQQNGKGTFFWNKGGKYIGQWKNGQKSGQGTEFWTKGDKYIGLYKNDKRNGEGTHFFISGNKYIGHWKNGQQSGQGTLFWAKGGKYIGLWRNGKRNGRGTEFWTNGDKYIGQYQNSKRHGTGTHFFVSGNKYIGEWKNGKQNGQGTFFWVSGTKYVGSFKDDFFNGYGKKTFSNGRVDEGIWEKDKLIQRQ